MTDNRINEARTFLINFEYYGADSGHLSETWKIKPRVEICFHYDMGSKSANFSNVISCLIKIFLPIKISVNENNDH